MPRSTKDQVAANAAAARARATKARTGSSNGSPTAPKIKNPPKALQDKLAGARAPKTSASMGKMTSTPKKGPSVRGTKAEVMETGRALSAKYSAQRAGGSAGGGKKLLKTPNATPKGGGIAGSVVQQKRDAEKKPALTEADKDKLRYPDREYSGLQEGRQAHGRQGLTRSGQIRGSK